MSSSAKNPTQKSKDYRHFRDGSKPRTYKEDKKQGEPKKGGGGGKGTWGKPGSEHNMVSVLDRRDPNYPEEDDGVVFDSFEPELSLEELKTQVGEIIREFFSNGDTEEAREAINKFEIRTNRPEILSVLVNLSFERTDVEREMTSVLLSESPDTMLSSAELYDGFEKLVHGAQDLILDVPEVATLLGKFIARAVADRVLHHAFFENVNPSGQAGQEALRLADVLLNKNSGLELDAVWGIGGGQRPVRVLSEKMDGILKEFFSSADAEEVGRCLKDLAVPHFHHEFVYKLLISTAEHKDKDTLLSVDLLKTLVNMGILTLQQVEQGFERVYSDAQDISIDIPTFHAFLETFTKKSQEKGVISAALAEQAPTKGKKRYLSQNDGGAIKN